MRDLSDYTDAGTLRRLEMHVGKDTWKLLRGRLRIMNIWRPLNGPIVDCPLAFCDGRTYDREALVPMNTIRPGFVSQAAAAQSLPGMEWYYKSRHTDDEPVVFKNFDTDESVTRCTFPLLSLRAVMPLLDVPAYHCTDDCTP